MKVKEIVNVLDAKHSGVTRTELVKIVNDVHRVVFKGRMLINRAYDLATGKDIVIKPDTVEYTVTGVDSVDAVYGVDKFNPYDLHIYKNTITFPEHMLNKEYNIVAYKKTDELLTENAEMLLQPEDKMFFIIGCDAWVEFRVNGSPDNYMYWEDTTCRKRRWAINKQYKWVGGIDGEKNSSSTNSYAGYSSC